MYLYKEARHHNDNHSIENRLYTLFENKCKEKGMENHPAVHVQDKSYTYTELNIMANQLARFLRTQGIKSGDRIGILLDKSIYTYVTLLAILKADAAYVPLDITFPTDRIKFISQDANLAFIISDSAFSFIFDENQVEHLYLDKHKIAIDSLSGDNLSREEKGEITDNLAYMIYTSGTTGNPKGVAIEHDSICNFVVEAAEIYGIKKSDSVYQGMIIAFDFSVEEIWVPLIAGASLVPAKSAKCMLGGELNDFLIEHQVTVMCCVPTLLSTLEEDIPSLRLLLVGGEACPHDLVVKWHSKARKILNTYGPTEATVTATWTELLPEKAVTIGEPIPSYSIVILNENLEVVEQGGLGEICIGGIGLARGYVNRDDLTEEYFIPDFIGLPANPSKRIYRTGDLGKINKDNEIEYLGRIDTQVKIRGYRIELTEIESVLVQIEGIAQVAVSTHTSEAGVTELVAYCVLEKEVTELPTGINETIGKKLPGYMIPAYMETIESLPMSLSNKVDRKKLPEPNTQRVIARTKDVVLPSGETEITVTKILSKALNLEHISVNDNIFDDLGGHSLSIALAVSGLRKKDYDIGLSDFYKFPTVKALAAHLETQVKEPATPKEKEEQYKVSDRRYWFMGVIQILSTMLYGALLAFPTLYIMQKDLFINFTWGSDITISWSEDTNIILLLLFAGSAAFMMSFLLPILFKWLLLGRVKEGKHKLWSSYAIRTWIVTMMLKASPHGMFKGTVLINVYARLLGVKVANDVMIAGSLSGFDLISVGNHTTIGQNSAVNASEIRNGYIHLGKVSIGENCYIGSNSLVEPNSIMEDNSALGDQSLLQDATIPANESWSGSPAIKDIVTNPLIEEINELTKEDQEIRVMPSLKTQLAIFFIFPIVPMLVGLVPAILSFALLIWAYFEYSYMGIVLFSPISALVFLGLLPLSIILGHRIAMPKIEEGLYSVNDPMYIRKLIADTLIGMSLGAMNSMYATLYLPPFLRLLGAKIGKHSEISTVSSITPSLLEIGDESFVADIATVGPSYIHKGYFGVKSVKIGKRTFIGNAAYVPSGYSIPDESLIGVLSVPSTGEMEKDSTWLGVPSFELPRRQESQYFDESLTFKPTRELYVKRWIYEFFRIVLPGVFFSIFGVAALFVFMYLYQNHSALFIVTVLPWIGLSFGLMMTLLVVGIKKLLIGTYIPQVKPLWDIFVRRSELVTALFESVSVPALAGFLIGTPFLAPVLRLHGVKVGKRCYIETTFITEFDLVEIGDDCTIGGATSLQSHLFEDRVMKMSYVRIQDGCSVGMRAVILYDSLLEENVTLDSLSLVMKGETLLSDSRYRGIPVEKI